MSEPVSIRFDSFIPRYLRSAQPACAYDLCALCAAVECALNRLFHGTFMRDAFFELKRDILGNELRVNIRVLYLFYIDYDFLADNAQQNFFQFFYL